MHSHASAVTGFVSTTNHKGYARDRIATGEISLAGQVDKQVAQ
jgi:hypothetical protein